MKVTTTLSVVYYTLLIIIFLYIIYNLFDFKRFLPASNDIYHDIDYLEDSQSKKRKKKFNYDNNIPIELKPGQTAQSENNIDFEAFKRIVETREFIIRFKKSLHESYLEKKKIYARLLLKAQSNTTKKNILELDSNQTRNEKAIAQIKNVLETLEVRMKTLSEKRIRKDFNDIIYNQDSGFASLVGREDVKNMIARRIYTFAKNPLVFAKSFQNIAIYGKSGVGKTKLAETLGWIYAKSGILVRRKFLKVSKQEFTSPYVDESAALTRGVVMSCLEGVLFIDEAYGLTPGDSIFGSLGGSHKDEAITELVNALDTYRGLGVVMVGGYEDKMEKNFMTSNEGMKRRFPEVIRLRDYNSEQLTDILIDFILDTSQIEIDQSDANYIHSIIAHLNEKGVFDRQAGDMQNLSADIVNSLYSSFYSWGSSEEHNRQIIRSGVNTFLKNKNRHEHIT